MSSQSDIVRKLEPLRTLEPGGLNEGPDDAWVDMYHWRMGGYGIA